MSEWPAYNFTQVAEQFGSKSARYADLTPHVLYELAAPPNPEPIREQFMREAALQAAVEMFRHRLAA